MNNLTASIGTPTAPAKPARKPAARKAAPKAASAPAKPKAAPKPAKGKAAPQKPAKAAPKGKPAPAKAAPKAPTKKAAPAAPAAPERRYTIDKDRPTQNGKTRPSENTTGGKLWAALEAWEKKHGNKLPTLETAKALGEELKLNPTSVVIAYYRWRKFWGIRGRQ